MSKHNPLPPSNKGDQPRVTCWRQGSVLSADCATALELQSNSDPNLLFLVVSHDCDLAERSLEKEPHVEIIEAVVIPECDPNLTHSKSTRLLHLRLKRQGIYFNVELRASTKRPVSKEILEKFEPIDSIVLEAEEKGVLAHWLAARYKRSAFPNTLLERLGGRLSKAIGKLAAKNPRAIVGLFLDYDPDEELVIQTNLIVSSFT